MSGDIQTQQPGLGTSQAAGVPLGFTDISGTPGNGTVSTPRGRCAVAAAGTTVVITNSLAKATSSATAWVSQAAADATFLQVLRCTCTANTITIVGAAGATAATTIDFVLFP